MSRKSVQSEVRKRDRFMCQYCGKRGEQYAHIVPESVKSNYALNNLVFLCYEHHQQLEAARASPEMMKKLEEVGIKLRDKPKVDDFLRYIFAWPAGKQIVVRLGGGIKFIDQERILESSDPDNPYVKLSINELGTLSIDAYFEDSRGNTFLKILDNNLEVHTSEALDIVISRRSIKFEHIDTKVSFQIRQSKNLDLHISGSLYLNGGDILMTSTLVRDIKFDNVIANCTKKATATGLLIAPGRLAL